jgi:hypothetical protein
VGQAGEGSMDWIDLAQDRARWPALMKVVTNLWIPVNAGTSSTSRRSVSLFNIVHFTCS